MDDAEEVKALAEKLMTHAHPEGPTSIELLVRRLPGAWGAIPIPPGSVLIGSALHSRRGNPTQIEAIYKAEGDAQSVLGRYDVLAAFKPGERFLYVRIAAGDADDGSGCTSGVLIARG
jgi:hypothetical protein